jgi:hypothetical protein
VTKPACSDDTFIETFEKYGGSRTAEILHVAEVNVFKRRRRLEMKIGRPIVGPGRKRLAAVPGRLHFEVQNGVVLIGSDAHYWPGHITTAHRGFVKFCKKLSPKIVVANGDMCDFASISRFDPGGWETNPTVKDEIEGCQERMDEIVRAAKNAKFVWPAGNHDMRLEKIIAKNLPELALLQGVHLKDWFEAWHPCWSAWINTDYDPVVIKHRIRGGMHATRANVLAAGTHTVTGHLHSLQARPFTNYEKTLWGVDTGTMADPYGPQFLYSEDSPRDHRSGFVVLTFHDYRLMAPECVFVHDDDHVEFRGERIAV